MPGTVGLLRRFCFSKTHTSRAGGGCKKKRVNKGPERAGQGEIRRRQTTCAKSNSGEGG